MNDCDNWHSTKHHWLLMAAWSKGNWWVWVSALCLLLMSCGAPSGSRVAYADMHGNISPEVTAKFLREMHYRVARITDYRVTTAWVTFKSGSGTNLVLEHTTRIVVDLRKLKVYAECYTTGLDGPSYPCKHPLLLKRMRQNATHVANRLPITGVTW